MNFMQYWVVRITVYHNAEREKQMKSNKQVIDSILFGFANWRHNEAMWYCVSQYIVLYSQSRVGIETSFYEW